MKKGRFSNDEMEFIEAQAEVLSPEAIAQQLDQRSRFDTCLDQKECRVFC
jgi:hypothetical protein